MKSFGGNGQVLYRGGFTIHFRPPKSEPIFEKTDIYMAEVWAGEDKVPVRKRCYEEYKED